jgi:molybdate transport system ATP-binding protein
MAKKPQIAADTRPWRDPNAKPFVRIRNVTKKFGDVLAVSDVSLDIFKGELFCLLGGSGSGKSTLLRMLAGFEEPTAGTIEIDGQSMAGVPPYRRPVNMMFQSYALFPHMTVAENIAFGLKQERRPKDEIARRVGAMLDLVQLARHAARRPGQLSGGERQRVALGRALLARPRLLLMDEPLAALDAPRRAEVLPFLARLRDAARVPIVYVTHALEEVDALADTLVLIEAGRVQAAGPLEALSARTDLPLLAGRRDAGAVLTCRVAAHDPARGLTRLEFPGGALLVTLRGEPPGAMLRVRVRARDVAVATRPPQDISMHNILPARLADIALAGPHEVFLRLELGPSALLARVTRDAVDRLGLLPGQAVQALIKSVSFDHAR